MMYPNDIIKQMEKERLAGLIVAEKAVRRLGEAYAWEDIEDEFIEITRKNFVTDYCNDQLRRYHRYDVLGIMLCKGDSGE